MKRPNSLFRRPLLTVLALLLTLVALTMTLSAAAAGDAITINKNYVQLGTPLQATVADNSYTVKWYRVELSSDGKEDERVPLTANGATYTPTEADLQHFVVAAAVNSSGQEMGADQVFVSRLPVLYVDVYVSKTDHTLYEISGDLSDKENYHNGYLFLQGNSPETAGQYDRATQIKSRGNSTRTLLKRPYKLKLDKKAELLGMESSKHYVLLANYLDESLLRNKVAYDLSGELGLAYTQSEWVELIYNGQYRGNYQLGEQIRVDPGRVELEFTWEGLAKDLGKKIAKASGLSKEEQDALKDDLETVMEEEMSWVDTGHVLLNGTDYDLTQYGYNPDTQNISGGYLFEFQQLAGMDEATSFPIKQTNNVQNTQNGIMMKTPEFLQPNTGSAAGSATGSAKLAKYVTDYWTAVMDAICSGDGYVTTRVTKDGYADTPKPTHYSELVDVDSMVNYFLVMEIVGNDDAVKKSRYAYKDQGGLLTLGPVWDFDWGCGSYLLAADGQPATPRGWKLNNYQSSGKEANFYKEFTDDPYFVAKLRARYLEIRPTILENLIRTNGVIDSHAAYLRESAVTNSDRWQSRWDCSNPYITSGNRNPYDGTAYPYGFDYEVNEYKTYLTQRIQWIDDQFATQASAMASLRNEESGAPYTASSSVSLALSGDQVTVNVTAAGASQVDLYLNGILHSRANLSGGSATVTLTDTPAQDEVNLLSAVAKNAAGDPVATNYLVLDAQQADSPVSVTLSRVSGGVSTVTLSDPGSLIPQNAVFIAARRNAAGVVTDIAWGTRSANTLTFSAGMDAGWTVYFLQNGTCAPLCVPAELGA